MSLGPQTQRFKFWLRSYRITPDRNFDVVVHADEKCARYRGSRADIYEATGLGDTIREAAYDAAKTHTQFGRRGIRVCKRCIS